MRLLRTCLGVLVASLAAEYGSHALLTRQPDDSTGEASAAPQLRASGGIPGTCECWSRSESPKLTVLSAVVGLKQEYVSALRENRFIEADSYDYEYCEFAVDISDGRAPCWSKVKAIQALLERGRQVVVAMDADAFFVVKMPFEDVMTKMQLKTFELGKELILSNDHPRGDHCGINTGVMVMNNTEWVRSFWQSVWKLKGEQTDQMGLEEQSAVCLYKHQNRADFKKHAIVLRHELMDNVGHTDGMFIAHLASGGFAGGNGGKYDYLLPIVQAANQRMIANSTGRSSAEVRLQKIMRTDKFQVMF